jgi:hypothetical protein
MWRRRGLHDFLAVGLTVVGLAFVVLAPRAASADAWSGQKGKIFVSDSEYVAGYASDAAMVSGMKKQSKTTFKGDGIWNLNLMIFLREPAGADKVNVVYWDVTKKREQIDYTEVAVKPDQKIVQLNGVGLSKERGFVKGHRYDIVVTRIIGGKEKVYAKTTISLK